MVGSDAIGDQLIRLLINEKINTNAVFKTKEASTSQTIIVPIKIKIEGTYTILAPTLR